MINFKKKKSKKRSMEKKEKTLKISQTLHARLDTFRAIKRLRTFEDAINYLLNKEDERFK
jgi:hypothetical protein